MTIDLQKALQEATKHKDTTLARLILDAMDAIDKVEKRLKDSERAKRIREQG